MNLTLSRLEISQFREIIFRFYDAYIWYEFTKKKDLGNLQADLEF